MDYVVVGSGESLNNVTITSGFVEVMDGGTVSGIVLDGGYIQVYDGGSVVGSTVDSGDLEVFSGGTTSGITVSGGFEFVLGGVDTNATVGNGGFYVVDSGGQSFGAVFQPGAIPYLSAGTVTNATVQGQDLLTVLAGGTVTGLMLAPGSSVDLAGVAFAASGTATLDSTTDVLTIVEGGVTTLLQLAGDYTNDSFSLSNDAGLNNGGSAVPGTVVTVNAPGTGILNIAADAVIDATADYTSAVLAAGASITVQQDASTPSGDAVAVNLGVVSAVSGSSITVQAGATVTVADVTGAGAVTGLDIGAGSTLVLAAPNGLSVNAPINFVGANAALVLGQVAGPVALGNPVTGFTASDEIDFQNVTAATSAQYAGGILTLLDGDIVVASAAVSGSFSATTLQIAADGTGGVALGDNLGTVGLRFSGAIADYRLASFGTVDAVQDGVPGRDQTLYTSPGQTLGFSDGTVISDPNGAAEVITHFYQALLGRTPDLGGLTNFTTAVDNGSVPYASLSASFFASAAPEFAAQHGAVTNAQFVNILEQNIGGSGTDPQALAAIDQLNAGVSRAAITFVFAESAAGIAATGSYSGDPYESQVYRLYETTLGRAPDGGGNAAFTAALLNGTSASTAAQAMLGSVEYNNVFGAPTDQAFVTQLYQSALGRAPDPGSQTFLNALGAGMSRADVAVSIANSAEARLDFSAATHDGYVFLHA